MTTKSFPIRFLEAALAIAFAWLNASAAHAAWTPGHFQSNGKPVEEYHCAPAGSGPFPVVIMLHGAGPRSMGNDNMEDFCSQFAEHGYYAEFIEYYSQTEPAVVGDLAGMMRDFPTWISEVHSGVAALKQNSGVDSKRVALVGYSLGSFLSLSYGATFPDDVEAIVEYYGGLPPALDSRAAMLPPVLILHGDNDRLVSVSQAHDLDTLLTKAGRPHDMKIYPGASHAFNFPGAMMWYDEAAAKDAWNRSLEFLDKYLKK